MVETDTRSKMAEDGKAIKVTSKHLLHTRGELKDVELLWLQKFSACVVSYTNVHVTGTVGDTELW